MIQLHRGLIAGLFLLPLAVGVRADENEVRALVKAYADAFNDKQFEAAAAMWAEDASYTDRLTNEQTMGRDAIAEDLKAAFEERPDERLQGRIDSVRMITADVAQVQGETTLSSPGMEPVVFEFSGVAVKREGKWLIHSIEEMPELAPPTPYDALKELEWMVGEWRDTGSGTDVQINVRWSPNQVFLIRSFSAEVDGELVQQGNQIIGWDPRALQIRSWTFNSDGSFGDAVWSQNGADWLVKSSQTLENGQAASGTFVLTPVDENTVRLQLVGHEIEGEPQPASEAIEVQRVPATEEGEPSATSSQGAAQ